MIHVILAVAAALTVVQTSLPPQESALPSLRAVVPSSSGQDIHATPAEASYAADRLIIRFEPLDAAAQRPALPQQVTDLQHDSASYAR